MDKKYLVTQNDEALFFEVFEDAVASMKFEDAELWEKDEFGCYIKIFVP